MSLTNPPNPTNPEAPTRLKPRRTLNRLALAATGVLVAAVGQYFFGQQSLWDGLLFYLIGTILFVVALRPHLYSTYKFSLPHPYWPPIFTTRTGWQRLVGGWLMALAGSCSFFGYRLFKQGDSIHLAWWMYLLAIVTFIIGTIILTPNRPFKTEIHRFIPNRHIAFGLTLVIMLACFMRLYNFTELPFGIWFDEAEAGLQAREMVQNEDYRPAFYSPINVTGHLLGLYALALRYLGDNIYALRFVSVLFGLGGVVVAYLFGNELRGPRFGLALAFLLAVARWHINFSRIAMTGIDAPFFEFLSLFFLVRLLKQGHLRDAMWAGLSLGFGLMFYTAFRLFIMALVIFGVLAIVRWWSQVFNALRKKDWQKYALIGLVLLLSGWLVIMPLVQHALNKPEDFLYRTRQISIFTKRDQPDLGRALWSSTRQHLLMFNFMGDRNGRHNLPGEPMLDPLMGILVVLGLGLALSRTRHPVNLFFVILLPTTLIGGIFSVDFEAPQSLRSIAVIPAVIYFAGLAIAMLGREAEDSLQPLPRAWIWIPATVLGGYIFIFNAYTYFQRQANDFASWNAFSAPETITGRKMSELGLDYVYILSPFLTNHPTTRFLAPDITQQIHLKIPDALPIRDPSGRPVAMFIHPDEGWVYSQARTMYPNADFEVFTGPANPSSLGEGPPSVYFVGFQANDLNAVRGLDLRYYATQDDSQSFIAPPHTDRAYGINTTWPQDSPVVGDFTAEWNGVLYVPNYGPHNFRLVTPHTGLLEIDSKPIFTGKGEQQETLTLAEGNHLIRVRAESGAGAVGLYWQRPGQNEALVPAWAMYSAPVTNHGLQGSFFTNNDWAGQPIFQRIDPFLDTYFHLIPLQRPYTVEWAGSLIAPQSGLYRLGLRVVQEAELYLDEQRLLTTTGPNQYTETALTLAAGPHSLLIRYRDNVDRSRVHLSWVTPSGQLEPIPSQYLWPPMGDLPEAVGQQVAPIASIQALELVYLDSFGLPGTDLGQFIEPRDVAVLANGNIVVADTGNKRVQIFDPQFSSIQTLTGDDLPFEEPLAVAVNSRDEIFVLESARQWVYQYDANGRFLQRFGGPEARLFHPRGLNIFSDDTLALTDTGTARVLFFNTEGLQLGNVGSIGTGPGQLNEPTDAVRDSQGTYFIAEAENNRIQRLDAAGNPLSQWAIPPAYAFDGPHLALAPDGSMLMTDSQSSSILRYAPNGDLLNQWSSIGPINLQRPVGIYVDPITNRLYITDIYTHQVHVFEFQAE